MWMRYAITSSVLCCLMIGAFALYERRNTESLIRQQLRELKRVGQLPAELRDVDLETVNFEDCDMEVSDQLMFHINLSDFLLICWYLWIPAVTMCCFIVAWIFHVLFGKAAGLP